MTRKAGRLRKAAGLSDPPDIDPRWLVHSWCHGFDAVCQAGQQSVPDKKWHKLTLVAFGEILENKWVHGD